MVVVRLIGGLGNQMFQYAAGRALALHHATELYLDLSQLQKDPAGAYTLRQYELQPFKIQAQIASPEELGAFGKTESGVGVKLQSFFPFLFKRMRFNESRHSFHRQFFKLPASVYLNGYWQDEAYFLPIRESLLQEFDLRDESDAFRRVLDTINAVPAVALHVRRGDYVHLASANMFHGVLSPEYYRKAVQGLQSEKQPFTFFIFSDDIPWCREHLNFIENAVFVDGRKEGLSAQEELLLMSRCRHNIIANSSFSWWAAWLNDHKTKRVIAPQQWFNAGRKQPDTLIPLTWTRL